MKSKGFTLIELLGVIVVLSLLMLIIIPNVTSSIKKGQANADQDTKDSIILAAKNWVSDNKATVKASSPYTVKVTDLQSKGYLEKNIKLPSKGCSLDGAKVIITATETEHNTKFEYEYIAPADCN